MTWMLFAVLDGTNEAAIHTILINRPLGRELAMNLPGFGYQYSFHRSFAFIPQVAA
jgi:hypothetical protein